LGRRIAKKAFKIFDAQPLGWELVEYRKFVWSDWLLLMELNGMAGNAVVRKYTWGLDVAGLSGNQSPERERADLAPLIRTATVGEWQCCRCRAARPLPHGRGSDPSRAPGP
jgi:hypothetical protein